MNERARFEALADALLAQVRGGEVLLLGYYAEHSDFARLNRGRVRQAGHVLQRELRLELVDGTRHAAVSLQLQGEPDADRALAAAELAQLRALLPQLPEDPYLDYATTVQHSCSETPGAPGSADAWLDDLAACSDGLDLVGLLAAGPSTTASPTRWASATGTRRPRSTSTSASTRRATARSRHATRAATGTPRHSPPGSPPRATAWRCCSGRH